MPRFRIEVKVETSTIAATYSEAQQRVLDQIRYYLPSESVQEFPNANVAFDRTSSPLVEPRGSKQTPVLKE